MDDAALQREITTELKPLLDELVKDAGSAKQRMQQVVNVLSDALRAQNAALIRLHLNTLNGLMGDYAALVARGKALTMKLGRLRADDERSPGAALLAKLTGQLGEQQQRFDGNYAKLKEMQAMANKALGAADSTTARLTRAWADMEAYLATNQKLFQTRLAQMQAMAEVAKDAVAERDGVDLAKIKIRNEDRKTWKPTLSDINSRLIAFFAESGKELPESLKEQFTRDRIAFNKTMEGLEAIDKKIEAIHQTLKTLALAPIDTKKAVAAMKIPPGNDARVKKALEAPALEPALDALARDLKLPDNGRELIARLKKAKLL
jgi:hypothetical protein